MCFGDCWRDIKTLSFNFMRLWLFYIIFNHHNNQWYSQYEIYTTISRPNKFSKTHWYDCWESKLRLPNPNSWWRKRAGLNGPNRKLQNLKHWENNMQRTFTSMWSTCLGERSSRLRTTIIMNLTRLKRKLLINHKTLI